MKYFLDTEFVEDGETIMPISLALVREDGRELYLEFEFDEDKAVAHDFVRENVLPHLRGQEQYTRDEAARRISMFMGLGPRHPAESKPNIEVWAYFADYDWVLFCQVFGTMRDLPKGCPRYCMDLMQWWTQLGYPRGVKPPKPVKAHDALADADWNHEFYKNLSNYVEYDASLDESETEQWLTDFRTLDELDPARAKRLVEDWKSRLQGHGVEPPERDYEDFAAYALAVRNALADFLGKSGL